jgi:hypothetical protein
MEPDILEELKQLKIDSLPPKVIALLLGAIAEIERLREFEWMYNSLNK